MRVLLICAILVLLTLSGPQSHACTAFCAYKGGPVLVGNNEDFFNTNTKMWYVAPAEGRYGGVYFGFEDLYPQGGMNEKGLFVDGFATESYKVTKSHDKPFFQGNMVVEAMATCATVEEVVDFFGNYNLTFFDTFMLMFADRTGDSVIIEGDEFVRKKGDFQITTNFYQSKTLPLFITCDRYKIARKMLMESEEYDLDLCRRILAATHNETSAPTQYSNVYDLTNGKVYLYHFHNYAEEVVIDLKEELAKGERTIDLPSLFSRNFAFEYFEEKQEKEAEATRKKRRAREVDRSAWDDYVGDYAMMPDIDPERIFTVLRKGDKLMGFATDEEMIELIPESDTRFFQIDGYGTLYFVFNRDVEDKVCSLTLGREELGRKVEAKKID
ncbi:MAG: hypothetical protein ACYTG7_05780 [Planctomycetota bacterium]|jgi:hypothetical protein